MENTYEIPEEIKSICFGWVVPVQNQQMSPIFENALGSENKLTMPLSDCYKDILHILYFK